LLTLCEDIMNFSITTPSSLQNQHENFILLQDKIYFSEDNLIKKLKSEEWTNNLYERAKNQATDDYAMEKAKSAINFFLKKNEELHKK